MSIACHPIVRRIPGAGPVAAGRGLELSLTIDEAAFGGAGGILLAAVLDRFFAKYVSINAFTETVLQDPRTGRGEAMADADRSAPGAVAPGAVAPGPASGPAPDAAPEAQGANAAPEAKAPRRCLPASPRGPGASASITRCARWRRPTPTARASAAAPARRRIRCAWRRTPRWCSPPPRWPATSRKARTARHGSRCFFFGLFGPDGPLPLHLTEYARDRRRNHRDPTFQRFADIFHHRALSLFYRAWADVRPTVSFDRPEQDRFGLYVGALIGLGMDSLRDRDAMPDLTKLHFAGHLALQTRHAEGLADILSAFFAMPVRVQSFIGAWLTLPPADRTRLGEGRRTAALGQTALLGGRVWSRQHKFRIVIGPLSLAEYERLLPGGGSFHRLVPIVRNYAGDTMVWDVNLILRREEVPPTRLGGFGRLGWTTWLKPRRTETDAADLFLDASADSLARKIDAGLQATAMETV